MRHENGSGSGAGSVIFSFLLGGIVGAGLTMLLTPMSGPEARRRLVDLKDDTLEKGEGYVDEARERVRGTLRKGREYVDDKRSVLSSAIEAGKEAYEKEKEKHSKGS